MSLSLLSPHMSHTGVPIELSTLRAGEPEESNEGLLPHHTGITEARSYRRLSGLCIQLLPHSNKWRPRDLD